MITIETINVRDVIFFVKSRKLASHFKIHLYFIHRGLLTKRINKFCTQDCNCLQKIG